LVVAPSPLVVAEMTLLPAESKTIVGARILGKRGRKK